MTTNTNTFSTLLALAAGTQPRIKREKLTFDERLEKAAAFRSRVVKLIGTINPIGGQAVSDMVVKLGKGKHEGMTAVVSTFFLYDVQIQASTNPYVDQSLHQTWEPWVERTAQFMAGGNLKRAFQVQAWSVQDRENPEAMAKGSVRMNQGIRQTEAGQLVYVTGFISQRRTLIPMELHQRFHELKAHVENLTEQLKHFDVNDPMQEGLYLDCERAITDARRTKEQVLRTINRSFTYHEVDDPNAPTPAGFMVWSYGFRINAMSAGFVQERKPRSQREAMPSIADLFDMAEEEAEATTDFVDEAEASEMFGEKLDPSKFGISIPAPVRM